MNFEQARFNMIEQQIRPWDVLDQNVLDCLNVVKRERFVPEGYQELAFADFEIPLPGGQHMLTPKLEARVLQELGVKKHDSVLEIGTGSGYMAALLAHFAQQVLTIDILAELTLLAQKNFASNGITNVTAITADAAQGWPAAQPYDVICVSGGLPILPSALLGQLKIGGRLAAFVGSQPVMVAQRITRISETEFHTANLFDTYVPPLVHALEPPRFRF